MGMNKTNTRVGRDQDVGLENRTLMHDSMACSCWSKYLRAAIGIVGAVQLPVPQRGSIKSLCILDVSLQRLVNFGSGTSPEHFPLLHKLLAVITMRPYVLGCDLAPSHEILEGRKSNEGERDPGEQDAKITPEVIFGVEDDGADGLGHVVDGEPEPVLVEPDLQLRWQDSDGNIYQDPDSDTVSSNATGFK